MVVIARAKIPGVPFRRYYIDKIKLEQMCLEDASFNKVCKEFRIEVHTLYKFCKEEYGCTFKQLKDRIKENGLITKEVDDLKVDKNGDVKMPEKKFKRQTVIPPKDFEQLCALQCTKKEIIGFFECSNTAIDTFCKEYYNKPFSEVYEEKRQKGLIGLRRNQLKLSERSSQMAIFLGKNWLNQCDKTTIETNNMSENPLADLSEEELRKIIGAGKKKDIEVVDNKE